jgi:hypothetical protein
MSNARQRTGPVIFSAALHRGASLSPRAVRQAIFWPSPMPVSRQCSARSRRQARPITAVITTGALGARVAAAVSEAAGASGAVSAMAASDVLQSGASLPLLRCRQAMLSAPSGRPRQLAERSRRQEKETALSCAAVGAGAASGAGAVAAAEVTTAGFAAGWAYCGLGAALRAGRAARGGGAAVMVAWLAFGAAGGGADAAGGGGGGAVAAAGAGCAGLVSAAG